MSKKYSFPILYLDDNGLGRHGQKVKKQVQAWKNFMNECEWKSNTAVTWLANEWNATLVANAIIFETEQDKIVWMLRWS